MADAAGLKSEDADEELFRFFILFVYFWVREKCRFLR